MTVPDTFYTTLAGRSTDPDQIDWLLERCANPTDLTRRYPLPPSTVIELQRRSARAGAWAVRYCDDPATLVSVWNSTQRITVLTEILRNRAVAAVLDDLTPRAREQVNRALLKARASRVETLDSWDFWDSASSRNEYLKEYRELAGASTREQLLAHLESARRVAPPEHLVKSGRDLTSIIYSPGHVPPAVLISLALTTSIPLGVDEIVAALPESIDAPLVSDLCLSALYYVFNQPASDVDVAQLIELLSHLVDAPTYTSGHCEIYPPAGRPSDEIAELFLERQCTSVILARTGCSDVVFTRLLARMDPDSPDDALLIVNAANLTSAARVRAVLSHFATQAAAGALPSVISRPLPTVDLTAGDALALARSSGTVARFLASGVSIQARGVPDVFPDEAMVRDALAQGWVTAARLCSPDIVAGLHVHQVPLLVHVVPGFAGVIIASDTGYSRRCELADLLLGYGPRLAELLPILTESPASIESALATLDDLESLDRARPRLEATV